MSYSALGVDLTPAWLSLQIALPSSAFAWLLGITVAWYMNRWPRQLPGRSLVEAMLLLPLILPPTVVGFLLLLLFGRQSWLGQLAEAVLGHPLVFSAPGAMLAATVVAFPLVYQTSKVGFAGVDPELCDAARTCGAGRRALLLRIELPLAWRAIAIAWLLGFARALGEFGATLMVAGNIPGETETLPLAIYRAVEAGYYERAWVWSLLLIVLSILALLSVNKKWGESAN